MRWSPGKAVLAIGALHQAVGLAGGAGVLPVPGGEARNVFAEVARAGVVGAIEPDPARQILFWYLAFGALLLSLGWALDRWEARGGPPPAAAGWQLVALGVAGGVLIPASGFWLAVAPGAWLVWRSRRTATG